MGIKVVIVGGVAGGASAAARLRRLDESARIVMFERGEAVSFANCGLPYYVGDVIAERSKLLVQTPKSLFDRFNIEVKPLHEVMEILPQQKEVLVRNLSTQETFRESYDYLVLSPGARPVVPNIPGIDRPNIFTVRDIPDSDRIKEYIDRSKPKQAVVIGGGFIGLEMVENLKEKGVAVTLVEAAEQVLAPLDYEMASLVHRHIRSHDIKLKLGCRATAFEGAAKVEKVVLSTGEKLAADMVILGIGVIPETGLAAKAGLTIGSTGGIRVDEHLRTSDPYIYAVGDAIQVKNYVTGQDVLLPLAGPANKQGRIAANNIAGRPDKYKGTQGTAIARVLGLNATVTGANEKTLKKSGREYRACYLHPASYATYYPGAENMALKLLFSSEDGKVLGAQIVGKAGVDKRIDVIATAIRGGMTVYDLQELELAYAPPFSSAKDPVNMAGYIAANIINGDNPVMYWDELGDIDPDKTLLLDVRTAKEVSEGAIAGSVNIPVDELRQRIGELPKDKEIQIYCKVGLRGYIAARILQQHGFKDVRNLSGGYLTYSPVAEDADRK